MNLSWVTEHAEQRARERLGRWLRRDEWVAIGNQILIEGGALLTRLENGREFWGCTLINVPVRVLWEPRVAMVITVVPWARHFVFPARRDQFLRHAPPKREPNWHREEWA